VGNLALAIDFGSSNTAAAYRDRDGTVHEVRLTTTGTLMPSAVLYSSGRILVGRTALQAAFTEPDAFEPTPKRRLADGDILLGGTLVPVIDLVAAVFREVLERAWEVMGAEPDEVVLTHPENWAAQRKRSLATAAVKAGVKEDSLHLLSEPQAAAWFYAASAVDQFERLAVFDFGAGTCDVAVLDRQSDNSFTVVASEGVEGLGGQDLDARVHAWVRRQLALEVPRDRLAAVRHTALLAEIDDPQAIATRTALNDRIREAKEALSEAASAAIAVSGSAGRQVLQLTRDEFEGLIAPDITRAVRLAKRVLDLANKRRPSPHTPTIYLTGGSSHIPLVHTELGQLAPLGTLGDPKTVVAQGALYRPASTRDHDTGEAPADAGAAAPMPAGHDDLAAKQPAALAEPGAESGGDSGPRSNRTRAGIEAGQSRRRDRPRPTRKWIVGGAAVLAVAAIVAVVAVTKGRAQHGPVPVRASQLGSILLSVNAVNAAMGTSNMAIDQATDSLRRPAETISDERCRETLLALQQPVYQGSGYTAVSDQVLQQPDNGGHRVDQAAVGYPWTALAHKFLTTTTNSWEACAGQSVTVSAAGRTERWVMGDVTVGDSLIAQDSSKEAGKGLECQHALRAVSNVVLDVVACGDDISNQAVDIAEKMAAKVNR